VSELSVSELADIFDADLNIGVLVWKCISKYHREKRGAVAGIAAPNRNGKCYWVIKIAGRKYKRSRIIFAMANGRWPKHQVDHINGNSLDDRACNLREATQTQNSWNHHKRSRRIQLPMGVRALKSGKYQARIACNKVMHHLGSYITPDEAALVYQNARRRFFGEFA
jgi:hypothetical protein